MKIAKVDRSRTETYQRCKRLRFHEYHDQGMGIVSARKPLPLAVGGSCHAGFSVLLAEGQKMYDAMPELFVSLEGLVRLHSLEDFAVMAALQDFQQFAGKLEVDTGEQAELSLELTLRQTLRGGDTELARLMQETVVKAKGAFEEYLYKEQSALVEGMVRAYARRRLKPLLEQYEVLEVEREGEWLLSQWKQNESMVQHICQNHENGCGWHGQPFEAGDGDYAAVVKCPNCGHGAQLYMAMHEWELWFMSRPDAILRERLSNELYILSYKTTGEWDVRKARDAEHDMQGLSEGVEVEKRLGEWWTQVNKPGSFKDAIGFNMSTPMYSYLKLLSAPPRIMGIRYEYILKGKRNKDKALSASLEVDARTQHSPLVRAYLNAGMTAGDEQWNWSWDYLKEDGSTSKLYWKTWRGAPVWQYMTTAQWIDKLDKSAMDVGEENRQMGYSGPAQTTGWTEDHPLDSVFVPPVVVYRNDDDLRDWIEQVEAQEVAVAEHVAQVEAAKDEGERRHLLNVYFPQTRHACEYPTTCAMVKVCYGGEDIRRDPLGSGLYTIRKANHPQEVVAK